MSMSSPSSAPDELVQARVELWNLTFGYLKSMALECAVNLGIPNAIHSHGGAASPSDIVTRLGHCVPEHRRPHLPRLMRFLAGTGILAHDHHDSAAGGDGVYRLTPMSRLLVDDATVNGCTSLSPWVQFQITRYHVLAAHHLSEWFTTTMASASAVDETPFQMANGGMGPWEATRSDQRFNELFNAAMETDSRLALDFAIAGYGEALFGRISSLVDVAGGTGGAAKAIARAFPHVRCSVLDLPHVISSIQPQSSAETLVEYIPGDMMEYIPPADAVFLKVCTPPNNNHHAYHRPN
nr:unnamed protein product [Digitaria exilis]